MGTARHCALGMCAGHRCRQGFCQAPRLMGFNLQHVVLCFELVAAEQLAAHNTLFTSLLKEYAYWVEDEWVSVVTTDARWVRPQPTMEAPNRIACLRPNAVCTHGNMPAWEVPYRGAWGRRARDVHRVPRELARCLPHMSQRPFLGARCPPCHVAVGLSAHRICCSLRHRGWIYQ